MKLLLKSGRVINPATNFNDIADILIENDKIMEIATDINIADAEVFDATGLVVSPGLIDMHVHLREPGQEAKEDIGSGTRAAAAGGITTVACMPNTNPVVDNSVLVMGLAQRAQQDGVVNVKVVGALSKGQEGKELAEIGDMLEVGAVAITDDGHYVDSAKLLMNALDYIARYDLPIISHAEDHTLAEDGVMHEGAVSAMLGMKGRPSVAEDIAVSRDILLAEYTNSRVHIAHISSKGAVELVRQAKKRGVKVTAEVTPHHLTLTDEELKSFNVAAKVCPPLRSQDHVTAMIEGLKDGTIDAIVTDHSPHAFEEKDREFKFAPNGFTGMETSLGVILTNFYHTGIMTMDEIVEKMSVAPAKILKLDSGNIEVGKIADLTIIDPEKTWKVDSNKFYSRGKFTPYDGAELKGKAVATIVNGKIVMENGIIK